MTIDTHTFRHTLGRFSTGVTVATTRAGEVLTGLTINSFTSVSLTPPLVLICVDLRSHTLDYFRQHGIFAVNILSEHQEEISALFATKNPNRQAFFERTPFATAVTGAPILPETLGFVDARIIAEHPGGDHAIFLGEVLALGTADGISFRDPNVEPSSNLTPAHFAHTDTLPLAFYRGRYRHLSNHYQHPSIPTQEPALKAD